MIYCLYETYSCDISPRFPTSLLTLRFTFSFKITISGYSVIRLFGYSEFASLLKINIYIFQRKLL
jgi:hypothetical protein